MGFVLDTLIIKHLITPPTQVNADFVTESIDITNRESEFSIQIVWENGIDVNMELKLEVSNNDIDFVEVSDLTQAITDSNGTHFMDVGFSGAAFLRVKVSVLSGSIDLQEVTYKAKRRH